jgi:hypothetical protein
VGGVIDAAREEVVSNGAASPFEPGYQARTDIGGQLELNGAARLFLHDYRPRSDVCAGNHVTDRDPDELATTKLAVDRQVEERAVAAGLLYQGKSGLRRSASA